MTVTYSKEEVAKRNGKNGEKTWIIIKNSVYDVSDFLKEHPGSPEVILEYAGKDATTEFNAIGHSPDAKAILHTLKIGEFYSELNTSDNNQTINEQQTKSCWISRITCGLYKS